MLKIMIMKKHLLQHDKKFMLIIYFLALVSKKSDQHGYIKSHLNILIYKQMSINYIKY